MDWNDGWNYRVRPVISYNFVPVTSDGAALGTAALPWSDLYLASGSVIDWDNGNIQLINSGGFIYFTGGGLGVYRGDAGATDVPLYLQNFRDAASVPVALFDGARATRAANDEGYVGLRLSDSVGNQDEFARLTWRGKTVTSTTEEGEFAVSVVTAGTLTECFRMGINYIEIDERTAPTAPAANKVRIFCRDNGAGKTQLCALFPTGAVQQIAIEP